MANTILTPTRVTREALRVLHNKLTFIGSINRQYDDSYAKTGAKIGDSLKVRLPNKYTVRTGATLSTQDVTESSVTVTMATQKGVDVNFSSAELTLSMDDFSKRIINPAMAVLAANVEADAFSMYKDVYNLVGTAGTTPNSLLVYLQARQKLNQFLVPKDNRRSVAIESGAMAATVDALKGLFHSATDIEKQYKEGMMGRTGGFTFYENELVPAHTCGSRDNTTPLVNGASQTGASLICDGFDANVTIKKGDIFTLASVFAVHPETRAAYSFLQQFTVTADATASGAGAVTLAISPSITTSGALQNVDAGPADNAALTFVGTASTNYPMNLAYHEDAFTFVSADLEMPHGVDFAAREEYEGISMRIVRQYDITNDKFPCRIDILYGYKTLRADQACRIIG